MSVMLNSRPANVGVHTTQSVYHTQHTMLVWKLQEANTMSRSSIVRGAWRRCVLSALIAPSQIALAATPQDGSQAGREEAYARGENEQPLSAAGPGRLPDRIAGARRAGLDARLYPRGGAHAGRQDRAGGALSRLARLGADRLGPQAGRGADRNGRDPGAPGRGARLLARGFRRGAGFTPGTARRSAPTRRSRSR